MASDAFTNYAVPVSGTNLDLAQVTDNNNGTYTVTFVYPSSDTFTINGTVSAVNDPLTVSFDGGTSETTHALGDGTGYIVMQGASNVLVAADHALTVGQILTRNTSFGNFSPSCYATGTLILTTRGNVAVENLAVGDKAILANGGTAPITWIGHREIACRQHLQPASVFPIRVEADAFGAGLPQRDLWLSPDHAVFIDGALIAIRTLVNGASIIQQQVDHVTYWHVELPAHDLLLAEGLPAESFLENGNRTAFEGGGSLQLHANLAGDANTARPFAQVVTQGPKLEAIRRRLAVQSELAAAA